MTKARLRNDGLYRVIRILLHFFLHPFHLSVRGGASFLFYLKSGHFVIPDGEMKRCVIFCLIGGSFIALAAIVFKSIDKIKER